MAYTSPTTITASNGFLDFFTYVNDVTNNWFGQGIIIALYIMIAMGVFKSNDDFASALAISGFVTFIISLMFWLFGGISGWFFGIIVGLMIIGVLVLLADTN